MAAKKSGGFKGIIASGVMLLLIGGGILAVVQNNNIKSAGDLYDYFKGWSDKVWACGLGEVEWNCTIDNPDGTRPPTDPNDTTIPTDPNDPSTSPTEGTNDPTSAPAPSTPVETTEPTTPDAYLLQLEALKISERADVDYKRSDWKHWTGSPCNTRENVLKAQGTDVVNDDECRAVSGTWVDPYSGETFTDSSKLDIDHVIPLGYAASQGGNDWDKAMKEQFANDMTNLLAVDAGENRSKSDRGPGEYMPPKKDYHCTYAKIWITTTTNYSLSIEESDKKALERALKTCDS